MAAKEGYEVGYKKPPVERQFGKPNGNKRREGFWDIHATPRYKLEQMMKLTEEELLAVWQDKNAPYFERKMARAINKGEWKEIESMINQVYGQPKQPITAEVTEYKPLVDLTKRKKNGEDDSTQ